MGDASAVRAGKAYVEIGGDDSSLDKALQSAVAKLQAFGASVRNIGLGIAAAAAVITAPLTALAYKTAEAGQALLRASQRTGIAVESLSELSYAAQQTGADFENLETGLRKMSKFLFEASSGSKEAVQTLRLLGISFEQLNSESPENRLKTIANAMAKIHDPTVLAATSIQIFGRRGTMMIPMLKEGAAGLEKWQQRARALGITQSGENVRAAAAFQLSLNDLGDVLGQLGRIVGLSLTPVLRQNAEIFTRVAMDVMKWVDNHRELVSIIYRSVAAIGVLGVTVAAVGTGIQVFAKGMSITGGMLKTLTGALEMMLSPLGLVSVGALALGGYLVYSSGVGGRALAYLGRVMDQLKDDGTKAFDGLMDALAGGHWALAARIAWNTLQIEWNRGLVALRDAWEKGTGPIMAAWDRLLTQIGDATAPLLAWLGTSWSQVWAGFKTAVAAVGKAALIAFTAIETAVTHFGDLVTLVASAIELKFVTLWENVRFAASQAFNWIVAAASAMGTNLNLALQHAIGGGMNAVVTRLWKGMMTPMGLQNLPVPSILLKPVPAPLVPLPGLPNLTNRPPTAEELALAAKQSAAESAIGGDFTKRTNSNTSTLDAATDAAIKKLDDALATLRDGFSGFGPEAQKTLDVLKQQRDELLKQAAAGNRPLPGLGPNGAMDDFDLSGLSHDAKSRGIFNASAVQSLQGQDDVTRRIAKATEQTAKNTNGLRTGNIDGVSFTFQV